MSIPLEAKLEQGNTSFEPRAWTKHCIYRVPWCLRGRGNDNDFRPRLVSIGPYHYGDPRLQDMQFHKRRMLDCILKRTGTDISEFYNVIKDLEHEARACYEDLPETSFSSEEFVQMLILDGCFILDFLVGCYEVKHHRDLRYEEEDPIFSKLYICYGILMDMILLENQIPLFILNQLYEVQIKHPHNNKAVDLIFEAFGPVWVTGRVPMSENSKRLTLSSSELQNAGFSMPSSCLEALWQSLIYDCTSSDCKTRITQGSGIWESMTALGSRIWEHMMDLGKGNWGYMTSQEETSVPRGLEILKKASMRAGMKTEQVRIGEPMKWDLEQHVIALKEAGVVFKHKKKASFWDVKFNAGVLEMPQIMITEWSESVLLNLMAFELCHVEERHHVILSYILFMDSLVNTAAHVAELRACKVIVSAVLSDEEVADVFNRLGRKPVIKIPLYHEELLSELYKYCNKRIHRWRAYLMHNYFHNPWALISAVAAGFAMLLTILQTYYTVVPYYKNP